MDRPGKSEREIVAWTVARLLDARDLEPNAKRLARYAHDVGVTVPEVHAEWRKLESSRWTPIDMAPAHAPTLPAPGKMGGGHDGRIPRRWGPNMRETDRGLERCCVRCRVWKPATGDYFYVKDRTTGSLRSMCHPCHRDYQRERYVNVKGRAALGEIGVEFRTVDADPELVCKGCGQPIVAGTDVHVDGIVYHTTCDPDSDGPGPDVLV